MSDQGRQSGFSNKNYQKNMYQGWRSNQNQGFGWKQNASPSN